MHTTRLLAWTLAGCGSLVGCAGTQPGSQHTTPPQSSSHTMARAEPLEGTGVVPDDDDVPEPAVEPNERAVGYTVFPGATSDDALVGESPEPRDHSEAGVVDPCNPVKVYFDHDTTDLDRAARAKLDRLSPCVKDPDRILVQRAGPVSGFTPAPAKLDTDSRAADEQRMAAVRSYLRDASERGPATSRSSH